MAIIIIRRNIEVFWGLDTNFYKETQYSVVALPRTQAEYISLVEVFNKAILLIRIIR